MGTFMFMMSRQSRQAAPRAQRSPLEILRSLFNR